MNVVVSKNALLLGLIAAIGAATIIWFLAAPLSKEAGGRKCGDSSLGSARK
jgi:hypothetical protein